MNRIKLVGIACAMLGLGGADAAQSATGAKGAGLARVGLNGDACLYGTITDAIAAADSGDEIMVSAGYYPEAPGEVEGSFTFRAASPNCTEPAETTVTVDGLGGAARLFNVRTGQNRRSQVEFDGFVFMNAGVSGHAGLIAIDDADVLIRNSAIGGGHATMNGGCVLVKNASLELNDVQVANCAADGSGGAIFVENGTLITTFVEFSDNLATGENGGAIFAENAEIQLTGTNFVDNTAPLNGGALSLDGVESRLTVSGGLVNGNETTAGGMAPLGGGAFWVSGDTEVSIDGTRFASNSSAKRGGAVWMSGSVQAQLANCEFESNSAPQGAALATLNSASTVSIIDCDFALNHASGSGGAIYHQAARLDVLDARFTQNSGGSGGAIYSLEGSIRVRESHFEDNEATNAVGGASGGAVWSKQCAAAKETIEISESSFVDNTADKKGGAIWVEGCIAGDWDELRIARSSFTGNRAGKDGGAVYILDSFDVLVQNSEFQLNEIDGNETNRYGGALSSGDDTAVLIEDSNFEGNNGATLGGAVAVRQNSRLTMRGGSVLDNQATNAGGVYTYQATALLEDVDVQRNQARVAIGGSGGGMQFRETDFTLRGLTVAENGARFGAGLYAQNATGLIENTRFVANEADEAGGGMRLLASDVMVRSVHTGERACDVSALAADTYCSEFRANTAGDQGGAAWVQAGTSSPSRLALDGVALMQNRADSRGSALDIEAGDIGALNRLAMTNVLIAGNGLPAGASEAVFLDEDVDATLRAVTIADGATSAISAQGPNTSLALTGAILWDNAGSSAAPLADTSVSSDCGFSEAESPGS